MNASILRVLGISSLLALAGCYGLIRKDLDRRVYRAVEQGQQTSISHPHDVTIRDPDQAKGDPEAMYSLSPSPLTEPAPKDFLTAPSAEPDQGGMLEGQTDDLSTLDSQSDETERDESHDAPMDAEIFSPEIRATMKVFNLKDALAYGLHHARDLQNAKEDLYLAGLDLSLERHLWTPQFSGSVQAEYANYGQVRDFDHAMSAVAEAAVSQRLPLGGEVAARVISSFMRDIGRHTTSGETGTAILEANIPLLRGAGRVAYESRFQAERELIYAVRTFERFRRQFVVDVANQFFDLQVLKASISNTYGSYTARRQSWEKADFIAQMGRSTNISDVTRALSNLRSAEAQLVARKEQYASALDRFKVRIGMPVDEPLEVINMASDDHGRMVETLLPKVEEERAVNVALRYRLDLRNDADSIDDARRGVVIAKNRILPDLDFAGSVAMATDGSRKDMLGYNTERSTWRASLDLRMDDRMTERTQYRESLVSVRRSERNFEQASDSVRADVRRALRQIFRNADVRDIQTRNVEENELRRAAAQAQYDLGKASNQDVIDAENELLQAQDALASSIADYRSAILVFRLDTGTLFVSDDGRWDDVSSFEGPAPQDPAAEVN